MSLVAAVDSATHEDPALTDFKTVPEEPTA
jgi:hypothetical protein